jgi:hypothetical protein
MRTMMDPVRISETSVSFNDATRRYISEGCHLQAMAFLQITKLLEITKQVDVAVMIYTLIVGHLCPPKGWPLARRFSY